VAKVIARLGVRRGGRVGIVVAGAGEPLVIPPAGGRRALGAIDRLLAQGVAPDGTPERDQLAAALVRLRALTRQPGLVVIASDFRDDGTWPTALRHVIASGQQVVAVEVLDPRELELPDAGVLVLVDPETGELHEDDTSSERLRAAFAAAEAERRERLAHELRRTGAVHAVVRTDRDWLRDLGTRLA
jgi:uncharacterized protein (DUF58 family)